MVNINKNINIKGIKINKDKKIKILAYADDIALLAENKIDIELMMKWTEIYNKASNGKNKYR